MKRDIFSHKNIVILLLVLGLGIHFAWLGTPNSAVFDEVHFGKFLSAYFTHEYYFDIHPPLGKLILAAWGKLWGFQPGFSFASIGEVYPDKLYIALRALPSLAGALLPLVIFGVALRLRMSRPAAALAGVLVALDNALLVQSRYILLDSFLMLFGFAAVYCYLTWRDGGTKWLLAGAGILGGMAMSIKWTGITFLTLIVILELFHLYKDRAGTARRRIGPLIATLGILPLLVYAGAFTLHFSLLTKSGAGDAFMSTRFQSGLEGNRNAGDTTLRPLAMTEKIIELNREMYRSNSRLTATHPYSSAWYSWPLMERPIFYWVKDTARIYLLGNPAVWWLSTAAVMILLINLIGTGLRNLQATPLILLGAWLMNMLPFMGINRVMFLYHYFTALIWAILMLAYAADQSGKVREAFFTIAALAFALFLFFAPLSYGLPLSTAAYNARAWFASWR